MKRFKFFLIDDEPQNYPQFIKLLETYNYLRPGKYRPDKSSGRLGWNKDESQCMAYQVVTSSYGAGGYAYTYCSALESFKGNHQEFDFYVFDLYFGQSNTLNPRHVVNNCSEAQVYKPESEAGKLVVAGMDFLKLAPADGFKIIYSANTANELYRAAMRDLNPANIVVMDVSPGEKGYFSDATAYRESFKKLDAYLKRRQVEIMSRQTAAVRERVNSRLINTASELDIKDIDVADIQDEPGNTSSDDYWSLQTLFPRQVNTFRETSGVEDKRKAIEYIREVVRPNFRWLVQWALHDHFTPMEERAADRVEYFKWRVETLKQLDSPDIVKGKKVQPSYGDKRITGFEDALTYTLLDGKPLDRFPDETNELTISQLRSKVARKWADVGMFDDEQIQPTPNTVKAWAKDGIYALDIWYIYHVAQSNKHHINATKCDVRMLRYGDEIEFSFRYDASAAGFTVDQLTELMGGAVRDARKALKYPDLRIATEGIEDVVNLVCKRYGGQFELVLGNRMMTASLEHGTNVSDVAGSNTDVYYRVVLSSRFGQ